MTIVLVGGCSPLGVRLARKLLRLGDTVILIDKNAPTFIHEQLFFIKCDLTSQSIPFNALDQSDAVINLIGLGFSLKMDESILIDHQNILESTRQIFDSLEKTTNRPTVLINTSSVRIYGDRLDEELNEKSNIGNDDISELINQWEKSAQQAAGLGVRVVLMRNAPILGVDGFLHSLKQSKLLGRFYKLSEKNFWQPWIHEEDLINAYIFALQTSTLQGPVNVVAPGILKHSDFMEILAQSHKKKLKGLLPKLWQKILFKRIPHNFDQSQKVLPVKIIDKGFIFIYPDLAPAITTLKKYEKSR